MLQSCDHAYCRFQINVTKTIDFGCLLFNVVSSIGVGEITSLEMIFGTYFVIIIIILLLRNCAHLDISYIYIYDISQCTTTMLLHA